MTHIQLFGIGGSGMSAIARVLLESGETVSGSDRQLSPLAQGLADSGVQVMIGHRPENILGAEVVVRSSAVGDDNPEVAAALQAGVPVLKRADFLGAWIGPERGRRLVAVAGTHGKTTTTAMVSWLLSALGQDPSYIIGGVSLNLGGNAHASRMPLFVIEADEYDRMFLGLRPEIAVITNIEHDHPDCYPTPGDFASAFDQFARRVLPGGGLVTCLDDPGAAELARQVVPSADLRLRTYSVGQPADYQALNLAPNHHGGLSFDFLAAGREPTRLQVALQVPGEHNVRNALAALAVVDLLGLPLQAAAAAMVEFCGTGRRFELRGQAAGVMVYDDYAHHPTEIRATLSAARLRFPGRAVWAVWQPHTYSRTRTLLDGFAAAFEDADRVIVTEIYAAREQLPADGFSALQVMQAIAQRGVQVTFAPSLVQARQLLATQVRSGDVVLVLSAGDADQISVGLLSDLESREAAHG